MKKNNIRINLLMVIAILAVIFTACNKDDEYEQPNTFSDVGWYVAYPVNPLPDTLLANKDNYITFSNLSQNFTSHKWEIESGNFFLEKPIKREDSIFDDKIIGSGSTADKTAAVLFRKSGFNKVTLRNTFPEKVTFRGPDDLTIEADSIAPGQWVLEKEFVVDVYDTIVPKIRIEQKGEVKNHESATDTIFVEAGDSLEFFDETEIGRPDDWTWNVAGSSSTEQNPSIVLKKLGIFPENKVTFRRSGNNIPTDWETYEIPVPIRVIPSSQPFQLFGTITELEDQLIKIPFNGEFAPFIDQEQFFTVTLNGVENTNFILSINPDDATILDLQFNETIYRSDEIIIAYNGNGTLQSTDTRSPELFSETVSMFQHEAVVYDFEDPSTHLNWTPHASNLPTTSMAISSEQAASGTYSIRLEGTADGAWSAFENVVDQFSLRSDTAVQLEFKFYKETGDYAMFGPWINQAGETRNQFWTNIGTSGNSPSGEWVTFRNDATWNAPSDADDYEFFMRYNRAGIIYFDDIRILYVDERP